MGLVRKVVTFIKEALAELRKVVWPTRQKAMRLTGVVVIVTILAGAFLAAVDFGLGKGIEYVIDTSQKKNAGNVQNVPANGQTVPIQPNGQTGQQPTQ